VKKVLFFITILASLFIIKDLLYSIYTLWHKNDLLIVAQSELFRQRKENLKLKTQLSDAKRLDFIESEARNKLFMAKTGESVVILPQPSPTPAKQIQVTVQPNWQQWVNLFFANTY
jgi:cell division protein FtsB